MPGLPNNNKTTITKRIVSGCLTRVFLAPEMVLTKLLAGTGDKENSSIFTARGSAVVNPEVLTTADTSLAVMTQASPECNLLQPDTFLSVSQQNF